MVAHPQVKKAVLEERKAQALADKGRREDIEAELKAFHVDFKYRSNVPLSELDVEKSLHNQARFESLDPQTVEIYAAAMARGDVFPANVVYKPNPTGRLVNVDGNHRTAAASKNKLPVDVYELDARTDARTIVLLTYRFNTLHGKTTSHDERIAHAVSLVDGGASAAEAAAALNVRKQDVTKALLKQDADRRADVVGLRRNEWDALKDSVKGVLKRIHTDEGFRSAAILARKANLAMDECSSLVSELNSATRSGQKQEAMVEYATRHTYKQRIQAGASGVLTSAEKRRQGPKSRLNLWLGNGLTMPDDFKLYLELYAPAEREETAKHLQQVSQFADALATALLEG